jgi:hypothetical protein
MELRRIRPLGALPRLARSMVETAGRGATREGRQGGEDGKQERGQGRARRRSEREARQRRVGVGGRRLAKTSLHRRERNPEYARREGPNCKMQILLQHQCHIFLHFADATQDGVPVARDDLLFPNAFH